MTGAEFKSWLSGFHDCLDGKQPDFLQWSAICRQASLIDEPKPAPLSSGLWPKVNTAATQAQINQQDAYNQQYATVTKGYTNG